MRLTSILFIFIFFFIQCDSPQSPESEMGIEEAHLGKIDFSVNGLPEAQEAFMEGLLLLHSFEYEDARAAFQFAQQKDSTCVMAYWGEAMTYNQPLWRRQQLEKARAVLYRLGELKEERLIKAGEGIERDLLSSVDVLYFGEGSKNDRDIAYAEAMELLNKKYPENHEVAAFYALSLIGAVPVGRDEEMYARSAAISEGIMAENPDHPGALHYLIHAYDDPDHAYLARKAADSYAEVAPDAAHALHMPSHIFVALGMWHEVVASNIESWEASVKRMEEKGLSGGARSYHALNWLQYALLQQGNEEAGRQMLRDMVTYVAEDPTKSARAYLVDMKGGYLVESGNWEGPEAAIEVNLEDLNVVHRAVYAFIDGMVAYRRADAEMLRSQFEKVRVAREQAALMVTDKGLPMCAPAGASGYAPNRQDLNKTEVIELELKALLADLEGDELRAEEIFQKATELENESTFSYGPPPIVYPSFELFADWLVRKNRPADALVQLDLALQRGPGRRRALETRIEAGRLLGDDELVENTRQQLEEIDRLARGQNLLQTMTLQ